ncbi:pilus assembly protein N-terminal domain-containing protein [Blastopirellula sp. J2-11]|uniref:type II and III secretion system protein family protein n=1 Tax=Blastopirellula sp. J2-11 TaxID=2943192 RepID=UPI0021C9FFF7|nr:pilus assembly protein N-terminal domain-containing protein [Blastopirellula sp. J2-11]UUO05479.1 pilus assembly protein N-terminal domain-containing protein [Blastopirellula sp. J2-11]
MMTSRRPLGFLYSYGVACLLIAIATPAANAQDMGVVPNVNFKVDAPNQRLEMMVNSSRIFTLDAKIPKAQVNNPDLLRLTPLAPNKIQVSALKPGVTQVNLWNEDGTIHTIDIIVIGDGRELQLLLETEFPNSSIKVRPLASSVVLSGYVDRPEAVSRIVAMAEDYYPKVINNITVGGVQQVMLKVKVYEVSRTKLRRLGIDWASIGSDYFVSSTAANVLGPAGVLAQPANIIAQEGGNALSAANQTVQFGVLGSSTQFFGFLDALRQNNVAKLSAEPTLATISGRPASFLSGGEVPIQVASGLGTTSIEYKQYGTRVDFVPIVLGNGNLKLEVRPEVSEPDYSVAINGTPGFRTRWVDTAVEMKAGQSFALAGLIQEKIETETRGLPYLADLPWLGAAFRRNTDSRNEVELLIIVTPELVGALNPEEVPCEYPGSSTGIVNDCELYGRGYVEVPACPPGGACIGEPGMIGPYDGENIAPGPPVIEIVEPAAAGQSTQMRMPAQQPVPAAPVRISPMAPPKSSTVEASNPLQPAQSEPTLIGPVGYDSLRF